MKTLLDTLGAVVERVEVTKSRAAPSMRRSKLRTRDGVRILDARPADSIALAARVDAPIWVADEAFEEAGIVDKTEGPHEDEDAKLAEFMRFLDDLDSEDFQG